MATKAISELTSAPAVSTTDLFETSCENQSSSSGYSSHKQSLGDISDAIGEDFTHNSLNTTSKNLVGAINEVANDKNLSDTYDPTATYAVGDYCIYNTTLYKCVTAVETAENFDSNKWERCLITNELGQGGGSGGDPITELTGRLAAGETEITLTDSHIETDGIYDFYTSKYGVVPTDVEIAAGSVTLTFDAQSENITVMVRKWGESGGGGSSSWDYSTTETDTGQKWIDGKEIYCKVINGTFNFTVGTPVNIIEKGDIESLVDCRIYATGGIASPQVYFDSNVIKGFHFARFDATSIILYYTKTTTGG